MFVQNTDGGAWPVNAEKHSALFILANLAGRYMKSFIEMGKEINMRGRGCLGNK